MRGESTLADPRLAALAADLGLTTSHISSEQRERCEEAVLEIAAGGSFVRVVEPRIYQLAVSER